MARLVTTSTGTVYELPDEATDEDVQAFLARHESRMSSPEEFSSQPQPQPEQYSALDRSGDITKWDKNTPLAFELGNPKLEAMLLTTQALTNIPLQSWYQNASNIQHSLNTDYETWQRIHMAGGWTPYNVGIEIEKKKKKKFKGYKKSRKKIRLQ